MYLSDQFSARFMKTVNFRVVLAGVFCCLTLSLHAQNVPAETQVEEKTGTLTEQFIELKKKSNSWQEYKVVKEIWLNGFWGNVRDSLATIQQQLGETQAKVDEQNAQIQDINQTLTAKDKTIQASEHASTHISVLGIDLMKESFVTFFFATISILALLLGLAIYQFKRSNQVTAKTRHDYRSLQHELEEFRKKALERERKLRRELQTERNTVEELRTTSGQKDKTRFY